MSDKDKRAGAARPDKKAESRGNPPTVTLRHHTCGRARNLDTAEDAGILCACFAEQIREAIIVTQPTGEFIYANSAAEYLTGYSKEELAEIDLKALICTDERELTISKLRRQVLRGERPGPLHFGIRRKNERIAQVEATACGEFLNDRLVRVHYIARNVTEADKIPFELAQSERQLQLILQNTFDGMSISECDLVARKRRVILCNDRFMEMSGRTEEDLLAIDNINVFLNHIELPDDTAERLSLGLPCRGIASWSRPDGKENYHEWITVPLGTGQTVRVINIDRDITERQLAEEARAKSERWLRLVMENSFDGINICEYAPNVQQRKLLFCNDRYVEMSGRTREELFGADVNVFSKVVERARFPSPQKSGEHNRGVGSWIRPDGKENVYEWAVTIAEVDGKLYLIGNDRDILTQRKAQEQLEDREKRERALCNRLEALQEVNLELLTIHSTDELCRKAVELGRSRLGFERLGIWLAIEEEPDMFQGSYGTDQYGRIRNEKNRIIRRHDKSFYFNPSSPKGSSGRRDNIELEPAGKGMPPIKGSRIFVFFGDGEKLFGYISADNCIENNPITELDEELLKLFAAQFGTLFKQKSVEEAMRESEQRYRTLFQRSPIAISENDFSKVKDRIDDLRRAGVEDFPKYFREHPKFIEELAGLVKMLDVNEAALDLFGAKSMDELLDQTAGNEKAVERAFCDCLLALISGKSASEEETRDINVHGEELHVIVRWALPLEHKDTWSRLILTTQDVTQRKQAEEAMLKSERKYRALFENSPIALWEHDFSKVKQELDDLRRSGIRDFERHFREHPELVEKLSCLVVPLNANRATLDLFEVESVDELLGGSPSDNSLVREAFKRQLLDLLVGRTHNFEESLDRTLSGKDIYTISQWTLPAEYLDTWHRIIISQRDITQRKIAEQALRRSEQNYKDLAENTQDILYSISPDGNFTYIGPQVSRYGFSPKDILPQNILDLAISEDRDLLSRHLEETKTGERGTHCQFRIHNKKGTIHWLEDHSRAKKDDQGKVVGITGVLRGITGRKEAEIQLEKLHKQLLQAGEEERHRIASELHDSLGQQLIGLSLSLKAILSDTKKGRLGSDSIDSLAKLSGHINDLVREVRSLCHGLYPPTLESLGLMPALRQLATEFQAETRILVRTSQDLVDKRLGPEVEIELFRIAQEAISNAIRHGRAEMIEVDLDHADGSVALTVTDDGKGFDVSNASVSGLGLRTMEERAKVIDGNLLIRSQPGKTCVSVSVARQFVSEQDEWPEIPPDVSAAE